MKLRCLASLHGRYRQTSRLAWCLDCGATYEVAFDGLSGTWRRRRDLSYGRPR